MSTLSVDQDTAAVLADMAAFPSPIDPSVAERRAGLAYLADAWGPSIRPDTEAALRVERLTLPGPNGPIPARLYHPPFKTKARRPLVVHLHGGGWVLGDPDSYSRVCKAYVEAANCFLLDVDYRRAPEHRFPAAIHDSIAACDWAGRNARRLGADPSRIVLTGDSAGGNLAAAVCQQTRTRLALQILVYPVLDARKDASYASRKGLGDGRFFLREFDIKRAESEYLARAEDGDKPLASPMAAPLRQLKRAPPTLILTAGFDPLRDEAIAYAARLDAAGVRVTHEETPGTIHGFVLFAGRIRSGQAGIARIGEAIDGV